MSATVSDLWTAVPPLRQTENPDGSYTVHASISALAPAQSTAAPPNADDDEFEPGVTMAEFGQGKDPRPYKD